MAQCTVLYPGVLGPDVPLEELPRGEWPTSSDLPNLGLLLNRAQVQAITAQSFEQQLLSALGYVVGPDDDVPVARIRSGAGASADSPMWCLDPAYVQIDRELACLAATDTLSVTETEARQLIDAINQHFADVLTVHYDRPQQWLVQTHLQLVTHTPSESLLQELGRMLPTGPDAQRWRSIMNEIQMLLHSHPVNEARLQAGELPVNSVWLWGGGNIKTTAQHVDIVYADHALATAAASHNNIASADLPEHIASIPFAKQDTLLVLTEHMQAIRHKDVYAWFDALRRLDQVILSPLLTLIKNGTLEQLHVQSDTVRLSLNKRDLGKWWRPRKKIEALILGLRKRYGN